MVRVMKLGQVFGNNWTQAAAGAVANGGVRGGFVGNNQTKTGII